MKNYSIILASGHGSRYNNDLPKQFTKLKDKTILAHTIEVFHSSSLIDEIIVVVTPSYIDLAQDILKDYPKVKKILSGGETRKDSSYIGVNSITDTEANVLIHDCARPFLSKKTLEQCVKELDSNNAVAVAIPTVDTIIEVENGIIHAIPERKKMMAIQTPQCFKLSLIKKAHELAQNDNGFTDDCGLVVARDLAKISIIQGEPENIKITYQSDLYKAEQILMQKEN